WVIAGPEVRPSGRRGDGKPPAQASPQDGERKDVDRDSRHLPKRKRCECDEDERGKRRVSRGDPVGEAPEDRPAAPVEDSKEPDGQRCKPRLNPDLEPNGFCNGDRHQACQAADEETGPEAVKRGGAEHRTPVTLAGLLSG